MGRFNFYLQHSLNDLKRNGRRTLFALFCVATGVAAIVALRSLGLAIGDTLINNIAGLNKADIRMTATFSGSGERAGNAAEGGSRFLVEDVRRVRLWAERNGAIITTTIAPNSISVSPVTNSGAGRLNYVQSLLIDPNVYPLYDAPLALDPPGVPLAQLFKEKNDVVISQNMADSQRIKVGDKVRVSRTTEEFTVRGIVSADAEGFRSILVLFFGFVYFDQSAAETLQLTATADQIYLKVAPGTDLAAAKAELFQLVRANIQTVDDLKRNNQQIADIVDRLIVIMGLIALLIGATGIIHTMLVVVRRRTLEIAVLKTLGVSGRQIMLLFLTESVIMGILGSLIGVGLGILLSGAVNAFTQSIWPTTLQWRIYPPALWTGFSLGVIITVVFGFLPTLTASAVRPALVLRPNEARLPATGCLTSCLSLLVVVGGVGLIVGNLVNNLLVGVIGVSGALVFMGICIGSLWLLVLVVSILPTFRSVNLRLALRGIGEHRFRTASTLLALIMGMFALSSITLISSSVPKLLNLSFQNALGGNVLMLTPLPILRPLVAAQLNSTDGVERYTNIAFYTAELISINGDTNYEEKVDLGIPSFGPTPRPGQRPRGVDENFIVTSNFSNLSGQDVRSKGYAGASVIRGRSLSASDSGKPVVVVRDSDITRQLNIQPGDKFLYKFGSRGQREYEVIGILPEVAGFAINTDVLLGNAAIPVDSLLPGISTTFEFTVAQINEKSLNNALVALTAIPGVFAIDVTFIDSFLRKLINQFTAIPTVVALLALFAGAVIIANTVSLSTLERRQRIGVMKTVGMTGRRTLIVMLLENGLVGVIGGVIGIGIGVLGTWLFSLNSGLSIFESVEWGYVAILMTLSVGITVIATLLSAWTAATEKPLNVLRYE
jgi:ABC-type antimicrobial peptide transport system permease subunit